MGKFVFGKMGKKNWKNGWKIVKLGKFVLVKMGEKNVCTLQLGKWDITKRLVDHPTHKHNFKT